MSQQDKAGTDIHMIDTGICFTTYTWNKLNTPVSIVTNMSAWDTHRVLKVTLGAEKLNRKWVL